MLSTNNDFHGPIGPSNETNFLREVDSHFGGLLDISFKPHKSVTEADRLKQEKLLEERLKLEKSKEAIIEYAKKIRKIQSFPLMPGVQYKFVDYDNTLSYDKRRFQICKELEVNRGKLAYPIIEKYFGRKRSNGKREYIRALKPYKYLLNYHEYYQNDPFHVILTAGDEELQRLKILNSGLGDPKFIIVEDAEEKIRAIIDFVLKLGFRPGSIQFIDDKIREFSGIDHRLSRILGIEVDFFHAIPQEDKSVKLINITRSVQNSVNGTLTNTSDMKSPSTSKIKNPLTAKNDGNKLLKA